MKVDTAYDTIHIGEFKDEREARFSNIGELKDEREARFSKFVLILR
jgi:hypothetical protein